MSTSQQYTKFDLRYSIPLRRRWHEGLLSGNYKQGQGCLNDGSGNFCCLGVLCEEFVTMYPGRVKVDKDDRGRVTYDECAFVVPQKIAEILGLCDKDGKFKTWTTGEKINSFFGDEEQPSLAALNDRGGSFEMAADIISNRKARLFIEV